jgi:hypothetical protein
MPADTSPGATRSNGQSTGRPELSDVRGVVGDVLQKLYTSHLGLVMSYLPEHMALRVLERYNTPARCLKGRAAAALHAEVDEVVQALDDLGVL